MVHGCVLPGGRGYYGTTRPVWVPGWGGGGGGTGRVVGEEGRGEKGGRERKEEERVFPQTL